MRVVVPRDLDVCFFAVIRSGEWNCEAFCPSKACWALGDKKRALGLVDLIRNAGCRTGGRKKER